MAADSGRKHLKGQIVNEQAGKWGFLTNHARVLVVIARDPGSRLRDIAAACDITERTAQNIVNDLEQGGYFTASATADARATGSAWTALSAILQRHTCPCRDCWTSAAVTCRDTKMGLQGARDHIPGKG
ncbi:MarR family transcriptional regulator [Streptomyces sp. NPDC059980]|uniref:MarR family transcriptional regulator n=1 Tax=Streptomyces sp. NPDC059980 TaxID=3347022 RepID=UPI0036B2E8C4